MQFSNVCVRLVGEIRYREANRNDSYAVNAVYACFFSTLTLNPRPDRLAYQLLSTVYCVRSLFGYG